MKSCRCLMSHLINEPSSFLSLPPQYTPLQVCSSWLWRRVAVIYTKSIDWAAWIKKEEEEESKAGSAIKSTEVSPSLNSGCLIESAPFTGRIYPSRIQFRLRFPHCRSREQQLSLWTSAYSSFMLRQLFSVVEFFFFSVFWLLSEKMYFFWCSHFKTKFNQIFII